MLKVFPIALLIGVYSFFVQNVDSKELSFVKITGIKNVAENVKRSVDENVDPCTDYMSYICGDIDNTKKLSLSEMIQSKLPENNIVKDIFDKHLPKSKLLEAEVKMVDFLASCENSSRQDPKDVLRKYDFFESLTNWPAFDSNWTMDEIDFVMLLGELRSMKFSLGVEVEFKKTYGLRTLHISPEVIHANTNMEKTMSRVGMLQQFGIEVAEQVVQDVENFENLYSNAITVLNLDKHPTIETTYKVLKTRIPELDWDKYFTIAAGVIPNDSYPVVIENLRGVKSAIGTITSVEPKVLANYVFYQFMLRTYHSNRFTGLDCYDYVFLSFPKIMTRLLVDKFFSAEYNKYFFDIMGALIETLNESLNIFGSSNDAVEEQLDKVLFETVFPSLTSESIEKIHENITIDSDDYWGNLFRIYRTVIKEWLRNAIKKQKADMEIVNEKMVSYILMRSLPEFTRKPAALLFDSIAAPVLVEAAGWIRFPEIAKKLNDSLSECRLKQLDIFRVYFIRSEIIPIYVSQMYMDAYNKWAKKYKDMIYEEDIILEKYGLSNKKILFAQMRHMALCSPEKDFQPKEQIMEHLRHLEDFVEEFNCTKMSLSNDVGTC